jgi:hypothetical protein
MPLQAWRMSLRNDGATATMRQKVQRCSRRCRAFCAGAMTMLIVAISSSVSRLSRAQGVEPRT